MPLITYPSITVPATAPGRSSQTRFPPVQKRTLELTNPSRVTHVAPATDDQITIDRAPSRWRMTITYDLMKTGSDLARAFELFLARLEDSDNYADFPVGPRAPTWTGTATVQGAAANALTLSTIPTGMQEGDFIRAGDRFAKIEDLAGAVRQVTILPRLILPNNTTIGPGTHWRGRMQGAAQYTVPSGDGFIGPVTLNLIEVI